MPVNPRADESREDFISRCMTIESDNFEQDQALAICQSYWEGKAGDDQASESEEASSEEPIESTDGQKETANDSDSADNADGDLESKATYSDYPEAAKNNAQRALDIREETGNPNDCGTRVGWERANQLASGEALSLDTVKRMASFNRHRSNSDGDPRED